MKKLPAKVKRDVGKAEPQPVAITPPAVPATTGFSFSYSYQEMRLSEGKTRFKSRRIGFEDGRLSSEEFEGVLPATIYERSLADAQRTLADQMRLLMQPFSLFLPPTKK